MRFSKTLPFFLTTAAHAAALPKPVTDVAERQASGYKNVAYFVNWVSLLQHVQYTMVNSNG